MDAESAYTPVGRSFDAPATGMGRGVRILLVIFVLLCTLLGVTFIMGVTNSVNNASRETREKSLLQRLAVLSGLAGESVHRYRFSKVYDAVTYLPVTDPSDYFYGLSSGHAIAIVKGWVDMLWSVPAPGTPDSTDSGAVTYNISISHPNGRAITGLEIVVTSFTARSDHLVEKGSIVLCSPGDSSCATVNAFGVYTGRGTITSGFARRAGAEDDMHMAFFLFVYGSSNITAPLTDENVLFIVELLK